MLIRLLANGAPVCDRLWSRALATLCFAGKSLWLTDGLSRRNVGAPARCPIWQPTGYPVALRRVTALVAVDGERRELVFLTNNVEWSAQTIADLYRCRWGIESFFKELKQTLQLADFLGHNANAVKWQVWTALLTYLLLRFCAFLGQWPHSFTRLFALLRSALWQKLELRSLLERYGTAAGGGRFLGTPQQAFLAGFG